MVNLSETKLWAYNILFNGLVGSHRRQNTSDFADLRTANLPPGGRGAPISSKNIEQRVLIKKKEKKWIPEIFVTDRMTLTQIIIYQR